MLLEVLCEVELFEILAREGVSVASFELIREPDITKIRGLFGVLSSSESDPASTSVKIDPCKRSAFFVRRSSCETRNASGL